jgi:hypothetical protein
MKIDGNYRPKTGSRGLEFDRMNNAVPIMFDRASTPLLNVKLNNCCHGLENLPPSVVFVKTLYVESSQKLKGR